MATRKKTATKKKTSKKKTTRKKTTRKKAAKKTTRRVTKRTVTTQSAEPSPAELESTECWTRGFPKQETPAPIPAPKSVAPKPVESKPSIRIAPREAGWVEVSYEGEGMFCHPEAGVFVRGTRTRLRASLADQLRGAEGVRLAA